MRGRKKHLLMGIGGICLVTTLLMAVAALVLPPLINDDRTKAIIVAKAARATGGTLDYDRVAIGFLPTPRLMAEGLRLEKPGVFSLKANKLAIAPRILPLLGRRLSIGRLTAEAPDIQWHLSRDMQQASRPSEADKAAPEAPWTTIEHYLATLFDSMATIDPQAAVNISDGRATLVSPGRPDVDLYDINLAARGTMGGHALDLNFSSTLVQAATLKVRMNSVGSGVEGSLSLNDLNPNRCLSYIALPPGIAMSGARIDATIDFNAQPTGKADCRFRLESPALEIKRGKRALGLSGTVLAGTLGYADKRLSLQLDSIATQTPPLNLSASAILERDGETAAPLLRLDAAAKELDIAVAAEVCKAIAGDRKAIVTAFDYARAGILGDLKYSATFLRDQKEWRFKNDTATGRLSDGEIHIEGIHADVNHAAGEIAYRNGHVDFKNLDGRFQGADFKDLDLTLEWTNQAFLSIESPAVTVQAAPFFSWLFSFKGLANAGQAVSVMDGALTASKVWIEGPLAEPENWDLDIVAAPQGIVLKTDRTPFDLKVSGGTLFYRPGNERSENVGVEFLDASLTTSHRSSGLAGQQGMTFRANGTLGPEAIAWLCRRMGVPDDLGIKPGLLLKDIDLAWTPPASISLAGELKTSDGLGIVVDLAHSPGETDIRKLRLTDKFSQATFSTTQKAGSRIELSFSGNLNKQTADRLFTTNQVLSGNIQGDFVALIDTKQPSASTFTGQINGDGLVLTDMASVPIAVERFSIMGHGHRLEISPSTVRLENTPLSINGELFAEAGKKTMVFDIAVDTDHLDVGLIQRLAPRKKASSPKNGEPSSSKTTPKGRIHFTTRSLSYGELDWSGVDADIRVESNDARVTINQAGLCGISTTGNVAITRQGIDIDIEPRAKGASLQETINCLGRKDIRVEGTYALAGNLSLSSSGDDALASLNGEANISSENGRILHSNALLKILSVLNITELLAGGESDFRKKGCGYSTAWAKTRIENGVLVMDEFLIDGNVLKITGQGKFDLKNGTADITVLVAPLKTVDRVVDMLPIVDYLTQGSLVAVPFRLFGDVKDLSVVPLPPSAVGKGLFNFMKRVVKLPFVLVEHPAQVITGTETKKATPDKAVTAPP